MHRLHPIRDGLPTHGPTLQERPSATNSRHVLSRRRHMACDTEQRTPGLAKLITRCKVHDSPIRKSNSTPPNMDYHRMRLNLMSGSQKRESPADDV